MTFISYIQLFPIHLKYWDKRKPTMDLAEIISKLKAKNAAIAIAMARIFNVVFWNKIQKYSRITVGSVLNLLYKTPRDFKTLVTD
jgi:hypothetical protein